MTSYASIVNRALQTLGTRTSVTDAELAAGDTNEAVEANLVLYELRDELLRLAPWDCCMATLNLDYITSQPGTPENQSASTSQWEPGQPSPPWLYEYQYPVDCLRAVRLIPQFQPGFAGAVPIFPVPTGNSWNYNSWAGPPIRFEVAVDKFRPVTAAAVVFGGTGYAVGDIITLPYGPITSVPIGAPVKLRVLTAPAGVVATVEPVNQVQGQPDAEPLGGSYFLVQSGTIAQDETDGSGIGATFTLTQGARDEQRVILCNQEFAAMQYCRRVTNPNVFDPLFIRAYVQALGAMLGIALTADKGLVDRCVVKANEAIEEARNVDGREGLVINDFTPDWLRVRGVGGSADAGAGDGGYAWTGSWSPW